MTGEISVHCTFICFILIIWNLMPLLVFGDIKMYAHHFKKTTVRVCVRACMDCIYFWPRYSLPSCLYFEALAWVWFQPKQPQNKPCFSKLGLHFIFYRFTNGAPQLLMQQWFFLHVIMPEFILLARVVFGKNYYNDLNFSSNNGLLIIIWWIVQ